MYVLMCVLHSILNTVDWNNSKRVGLYEYFFQQKYIFDTHVYITISHKNCPEILYFFRGALHLFYFNTSRVS